VSADPVRFGPLRRLVVATGAATIALLWLALVSDAAGAILAGAAALLMAVETGRGLRFPVTLAISAAGLTLVDGWRHVSLAWPEVTRVRSVRIGRFAASASLEIETPERAYVLSSYRLGGSAAAALASIEAARPA
jgi:signal transduction histidine kinase